MRQIGLRVATLKYTLKYAYNTRTLRTDDDTSRLVEELGNIKWHVVGLCETKRRGEGLRELSGGSWMYEVRKTEESPNAKGLALLINKNLAM